MKKNLFNLKTWMAILSVLLMVFMASCEKEPVEDRPGLPPAESLIMDFSDFQEMPGNRKSTISYEHFTHAFLNVAYWNLFTSVTLALPVTAYGYALQQDPNYEGNYTWKWVYDFTWGNQTYTAQLTGKRISNDEFSMEMVIALKAFPDQGFKWFDGIVRYDHTHAAWNLYKEVEGQPVKIIEVEWNKNFETDEGDITYTYVEPQQNETGSYIMYEENPGETYDAAYTISLSSGLINIEWNRTTKAGRIKDPVKFPGTEWNCWDVNLVDMNCP